MNRRGGEGIKREDLYGLFAMLVFALVVWCWHWGDMSLPFLGQAPSMVFAIANGFVLVVPQPVFMWLGGVFSLITKPEIGLSLLALVGGLGGLVGLLFVIDRLTHDRLQVVLCGVLFVLFPVSMREAVVQEEATVLFGFLLLSLAVLLSGVPKRLVISGVLFGLAVGVHPAGLLALPGFWYGLRKDRAWALWVSALGGTLVVCWGWVLFLFKTTQGAESFWQYMLGGVGDGFDGDALVGVMRQVDLNIHLFGWGGFVFGVLGLLLMFFQNRELFWQLALLGLPFLGYRLFQTPGGDTGLYLAFVGPLYALGLGTTWRLGSQYLAEGLQESTQTMIYVTAVVMLVIQVVGVLYTDNVLQENLIKQQVLSQAMPELEAIQNKIQQETHPEDLVVIIPDPNRLGALGLFESRWAAAYYLQRQVVFGEPTALGWVFDTVSWQRNQTRQWMSARQEVTERFVEQTLRSGRRFVSSDPFPFLHSDQVSMWMSALPVGDVGQIPLFVLSPGWPESQDHEQVAQAFRSVFDIYVERGYWLDAAACLQGVIVYRPDDVDAHRKLGDLYMRLGQFESAEVIYAKLLALTPYDESVAINLSGAAFSQDKLEQAIAVGEQFLALYPGSSEMLYNLAGYYRHADRLDLARKTYEHYLLLGEQTERYDEVKGLLETLGQTP